MKMRDHNCSAKWKNDSSIERKTIFVVFFLLNLVSSSWMDESVEIVPLGDMEDNQDRAKINGPHYDASLDVSVYASTEKADETISIRGSENSESSRQQLTDKEVDKSRTENEKEWETVDPFRGETNEKERHRSEPKLQMEFLDTMLENYDKRAWPTYGTKEATVVLVNVYINSIGSISAADMDYNMDIYLRQSWVDPRLSLKAFGVEKPIFLSGENIISRIWKPDLYFRNVKEAKFPVISNPNILIKIGPHGEILFSMRLALKLSCQMFFQNYPLDKQECHIIMGSSSYTANILRLSWMKRAVVFDHRVEIPDYYLTTVSKSCPYFRSFMVTGGSFSYLNATFTIQRQNGYHLVNTYLPISLIVMISWVSFFLNVDASPARTTLGVTTLLALTTVAAGIRRQLPPVSYIKAVDVWIGACSIMVFGALIEFAIVNFLSRSQQKAVNWKRVFTVTQWAKKLKSKIYPIQAEQSDDETPKDQNLKFARKVDRFARITFPSVFLLFNLVYWFYYLHLAQ